MLDTLTDLFVTHGIPAHIRSDNGPEFTADLVRVWLAALQVRTLFIEPGSSWENGYVESFNGKLRDELLDREIFYTLTEAKILIERWRREYNEVPTQRPGLPSPGARDRHASNSQRARYELRSLLTTGTVVGGRSNNAEMFAAADVQVAGSAVFKNEDYGAAISSIRAAADAA